MASYAGDSEFGKLLARCAETDVTLVALEIARDAEPGLVFEPTLTWIEARASELCDSIAHATSEREAVELLAANLAIEHDLRGEESCYESPSGCYLHRVIESRRGLPISLAMIYIAVANRLGMELSGVAAPMHFLLRAETPGQPTFIDAYRGGRLLSEARCLSFLSHAAGISEDEVRPSLRPASHRAIIIRLLNNLKVICLKSNQWDQAWAVQHRLTALQPSSYRERRDLALISVQAGKPGPAMEMLDNCLSNCPAAEEEILKQHRKEAERLVARWN